MARTVACGSVGLACIGLLANHTPGAAAAPATPSPSQPLWQIGAPDGSATEFALAPDQYSKFLQRFGKPEHAYVIGLSQPGRDWPCILPGTLDTWAGSTRFGANGWDQMNTLPIGFVLAEAPANGECDFTLRLVDTHPDHPPRLRVTVNGTAFERQLSPGGNQASPNGSLKGAVAQTLTLSFPGTLLQRGYNEIALRITDGSWMLFDALQFHPPPRTRLAPPTDTVIRSVTAAPYAISPNPETPATLRILADRHNTTGTLTVQIGNHLPQDLPLELGLQWLELPAQASAAGEPVPVRLTSDGQLLSATSLALAPAPAVTPVDYVDVFKGTAHSRWMIAPGPWMPFGMVKIAPDNQQQGWTAGYEYTHEYIDCFSHLHEWTMAGLGMMPTLGPLRTGPGLEGKGYSSAIDKATERGGVGFYDVILTDTGIRVELTATTRASLQRYTFPAADPARVMLDFLLPNEYGMHVLEAEVRRTGPGELAGTIQTDFPDLYYNGEQRYDLHFVMQFSRPFERLGGWSGQSITSAASPITGSEDCGAFVEFRTTAGEQVLVRTGISLVSPANAQLNLEQELAGPFDWDFAAVVAHQRHVWNELLGRVEIESPDAREKSRFYSNLYRALVGRNIWSDVNGQWRDPEERLQTLQDPDAVMLGCDAFWNTFWNLNQVMNLIAPDWSTRWVGSQLALYDTSGWLSKGPAGLEYISVMVAEHEIALLVAAYQHGLRGFDADKVLEAVVKMQTRLPERHPGGGWVGNANLENYLQYGYVALDGPVVGQGSKAEWTKAWCSNTSEYSYDDWCVAQLALALGHNELAEAFLQRSRSWRNVFDRESGFARPRKANGEWHSPFDPFHTPGFVEGNAWQYTWFVPHDVPGLVELMGRNRFLSRLNEAFERSAPTRFNAAGERMDLYPINHGNQPSMQAAWLFNWAGQPWLSQQWTRAILDAYYGHNPADAYLGDEDQGQMSAWFVMASLGLFQTDGGARIHPIYEIGSPLYPKTVIHLDPKHYSGNTFTIEARNTSHRNRYVQSASLNGKPLSHWYISARELQDGGRLELVMGPSPNRQWPSDPAPPTPRAPEDRQPPSQ